MDLPPSMLMLDDKGCVFRAGENAARRIHYPEPWRLKDDDQTQKREAVMRFGASNRNPGVLDLYAGRAIRQSTGGSQGDWAAVAVNMTRIQELSMWTIAERALFGDADASTIITGAHQRVTASNLVDAELLRGLPHARG